MGEKLGDVNLDIFVSIDNGVVISQTLDVDDLIENHAAGDKYGDRADESPPTWQEALTGLRVIRQFNSALSEMSVGVNSYLNGVENMVIPWKDSHIRQITSFFFFKVTEYFNVK